MGNSARHYTSVAQYKMLAIMLLNEMLTDYSKEEDVVSEIKDILGGSKI